MSDRDKAIKEKYMTFYQVDDTHRILVVRNTFTPQYKVNPNQYAYYWHRDGMEYAHCTSLYHALKFLALISY